MRPKKTEECLDGVTVEAFVGNGFCRWHDHYVSSPEDHWFNKEGQIPLKIAFTDDGVIVEAFDSELGIYIHFVSITYDEFCMGEE